MVTFCSSPLPLKILALRPLNMPIFHLWLLFCPVHVLLHMCILKFNEGIIFPELVPGPTGQPTWNKRVTSYCIQLLVRFDSSDRLTHQTGWVGGRLLFLPTMFDILELLSQCHTCWGPSPPIRSLFCECQGDVPLCPYSLTELQKLFCLAHGAKIQLSYLYPKESNNASTPFAAILKTRN